MNAFWELVGDFGNDPLAISLIGDENPGRPPKYRKTMCSSSQHLERLKDTWSAPSKHPHAKRAWGCIPKANKSSVWERETCDLKDPFEACWIPSSKLRHHLNIKRPLSVLHNELVNPISGCVSRKEAPKWVVSV